MNAFETVLEKAKTDQQFAKNLFADPVSACAEVTIELNDSQKKLLQNSVRKSQQYFAEQIYLLTVQPDTLGNGICGYFGGSCTSVSDSEIVA